MRKIKYIAVLAGNYREFSEWRNANWNDQDIIYIFVSESYHCYGRQFDGGITIGTFWERPAATVVLDTALSRTV